jgi:hypothetical protein
MCKYYKQFIMETIHNYNHFGLVDAYFIKFRLISLLLNGHYNTSFHVIIISMYNWILV